MALYKATKNLVFQSLGKAVIVDEVIDLEPDYAEKVNKDLKLTFPDVEAVLVPVDETVEEKPKKPKGKKADDETKSDATE
ncbi:hypothetical protein [Streptococcus azizii]|uniref:Uncharacterized protein n=1 Tax=Streptococcus azizii TaxID=1579424 RepID=A0AB36JNE3_9STRE|nr:hypothetical protein [Streptococcus azizii]ONK25740.1 hypothetical protein BVE86_09540 [Streptococcus azizii]